MRPSLDEKVLRCFNLLNAQEFEPLRKYWEAARQDVLETMAVVIDNQAIVCRLQGEAKSLKDLIETIAKAPESISKLRR